MSRIDELRLMTRITLMYHKWDVYKRQHRNNATYEMLLNICYLIINGLLMTEEKGTKKLAKYLDDQRMSRLFEKFVLNYYRKHYPELDPSSTIIKWHTDNGCLLYTSIILITVFQSCHMKHWNCGKIKKRKQT